jgi:hypothetical protein
VEGYRARDLAKSNRERKSYARLRRRVAARIVPSGWENMALAGDVSIRSAIIHSRNADQGRHPSAVVAPPSARWRSRSSGGMQSCLFLLLKEAGRHSGRFSPTAIGPMPAWQADDGYRASRQRSFFQRLLVMVVLVSLSGASATTVRRGGGVLGRRVLRRSRMLGSGVLDFMLDRGSLLFRGMLRLNPFRWRMLGLLVLRAGSLGLLAFRLRVLRVGVLGLLAVGALMLGPFGLRVRVRVGAGMRRSRFGIGVISLRRFVGRLARRGLGHPVLGGLAGEGAVGPISAAG